MDRWRRKLAGLLAAVTLFTLLPNGVMATNQAELTDANLQEEAGTATAKAEDTMSVEEPSEQSAESIETADASKVGLDIDSAMLYDDAQEEVASTVRYRVRGGAWKTIGPNPTGGVGASYDGYFEDDGSYTIYLGADDFFPVSIEFEGRENAVTYSAPKSWKDVFGHRFFVDTRWIDAIRYRNGGETLYIGTSAELAESNGNYKNFTDGAFTLEVSDEETFPFRPDFAVRRASGWSNVTAEFAAPDFTATVHDYTFTVHADWMDDVQFQLDGMPERITVGLNQSRQSDFYKLYGEDGNYVIEVETDAIFPYAVTFWKSVLNKSNRLERKEYQEEEYRSFKEPGDSITIDGHTFTVKSSRQNLNKLVRAGMYVGGRYIPFTTSENRPALTSGGDAALQSLLPLEEHNLNADLTGIFPSELKEVRIVAWLATSAGDSPAIREAESVILASPYEDNYRRFSKNELVDMTEYLDDSGTLDFKMIVSSEEQLDAKNIRYIITARLDVPDTTDLIAIKAAYAGENRDSVPETAARYTPYADGKWEEYDESTELSDRERAYTYIDRANGKMTTVDLYQLTMDQTWQDGPLFLAMRRNPDAANYGYYKNLTAHIYEGVYLNANDLSAASGTANEITDKVWEKELDTADIANLYQANFRNEAVETAPLFTVVWERQDDDGQLRTVSYTPFRITVSAEVDPTTTKNKVDKVQFGGLSTRFDTVRRTDDSLGDDEFGNRQLSRVTAKEGADEETNTWNAWYQTPFEGSGYESRFYVKAAFYHFKESKYVTEDDGGSWQECEIKVYAASKPYATLAQAQADRSALDVTTQIFVSNSDSLNPPPYTGGYGADFSKGVVFSVFGADGKLVPVEVRGLLYDHLKIQTSVIEDVRFEDLTKPENPDSQEDWDTPVLDTSFKPTKSTSDSSVRYTMPALKYSAGDAYAVRLTYLRDHEETPFNDSGVKVLIGSRRYRNLRDAETSGDNPKDVTAQAFSKKGYVSRNYAYGVHFNVFNSAGERIAYLAVYTQNYYVEEGSKSNDTYFRMLGATSAEHGRNSSGVYLPVLYDYDSFEDYYASPYNTDNGAYNAITMPAGADGYYANGFQTVFLMKRVWDSATSQFVEVPVEEGSEFVPRFWVNTQHHVSVYAQNHTIGNPVSGNNELQEDGKQAREFKSGEAIQYSAAAENTTWLKNYWVTFLTQQSGAKLFVNGLNGPNGSRREVFVMGADGWHDVFFANIGDQPLTDLEVRLENAQNLRVDDYWTVESNATNRTLAAFTSTVPSTPDGLWPEYGYLPNVGKVRLYATTDDSEYNEPRISDKKMVASKLDCG